MTTLRELADRLEGLEKAANRGEGEWQPGVCGHADLVAFNGEDITGVAIVTQKARVHLIAALRNAAPQIIKALRRLDSIERAMDDVKRTGLTMYGHAIREILERAAEIERNGK